jgi:hypothetical protein
LTLGAVVLGFAAAAFAMTQGEFQPSTRSGLVSLVAALIVLAVLLFSGITWDHIRMPPGF